MKVKQSKQPKDKKAVLIKELDTVFSIFIRQRDKGVCFTCGDVKFWRFQQNGHYVSRTHQILRWSEKNCNTQCYACNIMRHGNMDEYAVALINKYGPKILLDLHKRKHGGDKLSTDDLRKLINHYRNKIKA